MTDINTVRDFLEVWKKESRLQTVESREQFRREAEALLASITSSGESDERAALIQIARDIEGMKRECGMDPESPTAIYNSKLMSIGYRLRALHAALATQPAAPAEVVAALREFLAFAETLSVRHPRLEERARAALASPAQATPSVVTEAMLANALAEAHGQVWYSATEQLAYIIDKLGLRATPPAAPAATEAPSEPVARLFVSMERHDMGQSLAPPPPPFRFAQAHSLPAADGLPVGEYDLCLAAPTTAAPATTTKAPKMEGDA